MGPELIYAQINDRAGKPRTIAVFLIIPGLITTDGALFEGLLWEVAGRGVPRLAKLVASLVRGRRGFGRAPSWGRASRKEA